MVAIITGAEGNLGKAIVSNFQKRDYTIIGTILSPMNEETDTSSYKKIPLDLTNETQAQQFADTIVQNYGSIDVLVCTVGSFTLGNIRNTTISQINEQLRLNFETAYNVVRPVFSKMLSRGYGRIFMTGARPGIAMPGSNEMAAYSLGKSLLFRLTSLLNEEATGKDVFTRLIVPGTIDTPQNRKAMPSADFTKWVTPDAIADIIQFYISPEASFLKNSIIEVDGAS